MTKTQDAISPTAERRAHGGVHAPTADDRSAKARPYVTEEAIHDTMLSKGLITRPEWEAVNKFRAIYELANGSGVRAQAWDPPIRGSQMAISDRQALAKLKVARWSHDLAAELYGALTSICGHGKTRSRWAVDRGHHPDSGRVVLLCAIQQFCKSCT